MFSQSVGIPEITATAEPYPPNSTCDLPGPTLFLYWYVSIGVAPAHGFDYQVDIYYSPDGIVPYVLLVTDNANANDTEGDIGTGNPCNAGEWYKGQIRATISGVAKTGPMSAAVQFT